MPKVRLDQALVERGLCPSREKAKRAILAGQVRAGGQLVCKPGGLVQPDDPLTLAAPERYVSRGGYKLEHGLRLFGLAVAGVTAIDLGASTGGFTDCLLQQGAARVYAVDVGRGQLMWKLRRDPRVIVMEHTNARFLTRRDFPPDFAGAGLIVADCSFISLQKILPSAVALLARDGRILALVKPQFEAGKAEASRGKGVIRDPAIHARVLNELKTFASDTAGLRWAGETASPLLGPAGNKEFLVLLEKKT
jgi:23S rRNA (cytidine1920-2'-O)/16S rRNA (cytidine1409-2'-O)-methyltransferase